jgi:D-alanyl-lipoteichoic acid acyltransferase DltB (MBOAT superfamily)
MDGNLGFRKMLFNSAAFILGFLPIVLFGFLLTGGLGRQRLAAIWLTIASLLFYSWWDPTNLPLLIGSMVFNYLLGGMLIKSRSKALLIFGVVVNIALLVYFKYTGFFLVTLDQMVGTNWSFGNIVLPLAISFFTFQQIAYLVDAHDGEVVEHDFLNYCLFITFFPHLIAGPITHHREMLSQFGRQDAMRPRYDMLAIGATVFLLGLFKKVIIADPLGEKAAPVFAIAASGIIPSVADSWTAGLTYTLQIYFDFSGYSDMAIGLGLLFGIRLPANFNSPFKARNVIDYWSRWHMTLTRFLTAYIYNPIVMGVTRRRLAAGKPLPKRGKMSLSTFVMMVAYPTVLTMFISGVWHGAGWQFVIFGLLHGFYLVVAHGWRAYKVKKGWKLDSDNPFHIAPAVLLTFLSVVVAMIFFRANSVAAAMHILYGMVGAGAEPFEVDHADLRNLILVSLLLAFVWIMPNIQQWMSHARTAIESRAQPFWAIKWLPFLAWQPSPVVGGTIGVIGFFALAVALSAAPTEFLYFQF